MKSTLEAEVNFATNSSKGCRLSTDYVRPSDITITLYTESGIMAQRRGVPFNELKEGEHYVVRSVDYDEVFRESIKKREDYFKEISKKRNEVNVRHNRAGYSKKWGNIRL